MYNVSTEFNNKIKQNSRRIAGKLLLGNLELTPEDIINMNMEYSLGNDGIPAIGGAVASKLEVKLSRGKLPPVLTTQELKPFLGIEIAPGTIEYVPMGVFKISPKDTKKTDKTISLVGYDILFLLENSPYNSKLKFPTTWDKIRTELESSLKFKAQTLSNVTIKEKPNTIRELLSDVSELLGMNVVVNKLGEIEFRQLNVVEFDLDANNYYDFKLLADDDVKLTRLTVEKEGEENEDLTYGDDTGYTIKIKNDSINTQSELRTAYDRVFPLNYTAYECNMQGMPHVEVGDIINLTDRHGIKRNIPIVYHRISYSGGLKSEIRANAPSGAISSTGSTGSNSITQSLNDLRVNILEVNTILADKVSTNELDANVARIEKIINTNLEAINAKIDDLDVEDLTAINAHITALKGNVAEIDTILSKEIFTELASVGQIVAGSGIIADGAIGDAQISSLNANKIISGMIDTFKVTILGPDGRMKISGNKLQIFDDDGFGGLQERIFLGVDDLNNSALTLRGPDGQTILLTQDGLTDVGFTDGYNKLDDNSLDPKKIDIQKVVTRINEGTETIQASKIIIDNTTLDLSFNTIKNTVTSQGEEISNQRSEIKALDDAIKFKVDNQTFNQYKTTTNENIGIINKQLSKNTASIDVLQEDINLKVSQTDIDNEVRVARYSDIHIIQDGVGSVPDYAYDGGQINMNIKGNTLTNLAGLSGKGYNSPSEDILLNHGTINDGVLELVANGTHYRNFEVQTNWKPNTTYTIVVDVLESTIETYFTLIRKNEIGRDTVAIPAKFTGRFISTFTTGDSVGTSLNSFITKAEPEGNKIRLKNLMLLEGDYTDREVNYIEGTKSVPASFRVKSVGKNLFNGRWWNGYNYSGLESRNVISPVELIRGEPGHSYSFSCDFVDKEGTVFFVTYDANKQRQRIYNAKMFTLAKQERYFEFHVYNIEGFSPANIKNAQVELGREITDYEPYKEDIAYITAKEKNKIVNLNKVGNVADEIDLKKGKAIIRTNQVALDGSENWILNRKDLTNTYAFELRLDNLKDKSKSYLYLNGKLIRYSYSWHLDEEHFYHSTYALIVFINKTTIDEQSGSTLADKFKNWLKQGTLIYELAEPYEIDIEPQSLKAFENGTIYFESDIPNTPYPIIEIVYPLNLKASQDIGGNFVKTATTSINTKVADININLDSITERVSSTESKIIKVNDEVSTIESRVSVAERKITDSAIVETVRESTAYKNDLDGKANESDLKVAESIIEQHADQIAERVTIDGIGTEIIKNANFVRVAIGEIGVANLVKRSKDKIVSSSYLVGTYNMTEDWELNTTYSIAIKGNINSGQEFGIWANGSGTQVTTLKYDKSDGLYKATFTTPSSINSQKPKTLRVYNYPSSGANSASIDWVKLEKGSVNTGWTPAEGELEGVSYSFTGDAAILKGAGFIILNNNSVPVMQGDAQGNLSMTGDFTTYSNGQKALEMVSNIFQLYDWQGTTRKEPVGIVYSGRRQNDANKPGISIANGKSAFLTLTYEKNQTYYPYIDFDKDNVLGSSKDYPIAFWEKPLFKRDARFDRGIYLGGERNQIFNSTNGAFVVEVNDGDTNRGFILQRDSSHNKVLEFRPWWKQEIMLWESTKVNEDLLVVGSKNAVVNTENYGERLLNALETAEYYFADFGFGKISEDGECYIYIGDIFNETVNTEVEYHVIYGKYGEDENSKIITKERHKNYFVAKGTPGLEFSWFLVVKRKGYEYHRLEQPDSFNLGRDDSVSFDRDFEQEDKELEKIYDDKLSFDLVSLLLEEAV